MPNVVCCCLHCNHCSNGTWVVEDILVHANRLCSTHSRELYYLKLCRPAYFVIPTQLLHHPGHVFSLFYLAISSAVHSLLPLPLVSWRSGESPGTRPSTSTSSTVAGTSTLAELPVFSFHLKFYRIIHYIAQLWMSSHHLYSSTLLVP